MIHNFLHLSVLCFSFSLLSSTYCTEHMQNSSDQIIIESIKNKYADIKIGLYSGTFDPPTKAHDTIIRSALENLNLERLYIFVNKNGVKNYKYSSEERVEMLKRMLKDIEDRVVIIAQSSDCKRADYQMIKNILIKDKVIHIVGEDSYERRLLILPENRIQFDAIVILPRIISGQNEKRLENLESNAFYLPINRKELLGISSTKVRSQLANRDYHGIALSTEVLSYIIEHHLYIKNDNNNHKDYFYKEYYAYVGYLFSIGELTTPCPKPPYDPLASENAWLELFYRWTSIQTKKV